MRTIKYNPRSLRARSTLVIENCERRLLMSTYTVNTVSDAINPGAGLLTLRQAVADANAHTGADTIAFSTKFFTPAGLHTINLSQGQIIFTDTSGTTTVDGPGQSVLAINADQHSRVFKVSDGVTVEMSGLTVTEGSFDAPAGALAAGGGVLNNGKLELTNVSVTDSSAVGAGGPSYVSNIGDAEGGGVYSNGTLTLVDSVVTGDTVSGGNIQQYESYGSFTGYAEGGGIFSSGSLTISGSVISQNSATGTGPEGDAEGGGIYSSGTSSISSTSLAGDEASVGPTNAGIFGGAIYAGGPTTINGSTFSNDMALGYPALTYGPLSEGPAWGGAVYSTNGLTVESSTFTGNQAIGSGGSVASNEAGADGYGGAIAATGSLTISGSTLSTNLAKGGVGQPSGGGIESGGMGGAVYASAKLSINSSTISGNTAQAGVDGGESYGDPGGVGEGGGIFAGGISTISNSTVAGNSALGGPGDFNDSGNNTYGGEGAGGGIYSVDSLTVSNSTLAENAATGGVGGIGYSGLAGSGGDGTGGAIDSLGTLDVVNSTITGNTATGGAGGENQNSDYTAGNGGNGSGAGIYASTAIKLSDSTIVQNTSIAGAGGDVEQQTQYNAPGSPGTSSGGGIKSGKNTLVDNTILSANNAISGADVYSSLSASSSHNLIGYGGGLTNGVNGNIIGIHNPQLMPLGWYGGPTETMLPMPGSPVIGAGSVAVIPSGVTTDQRGDSRISGKSVDIGSVEFGNVAITGTVFNDENASGKQSSGDPGLAGFTVYLDLNHDGELEAGDYSTTTNAAGQYTFNGLVAGNYTVRVVPEKAYRATTNTFANITAKAGAVATVAALGQTQDALISGTVSNDHAPLTNVRVYIDLTGSGTFVPGDPSTLTNSSGFFSLNIALLGVYKLRIVTSKNQKTTAPASGFYTVTLGKASARIDNLFELQPIG